MRTRSHGLRSRRSVARSVTALMGGTVGVQCPTSADLQVMKRPFHRRQHDFDLYLWHLVLRDLGAAISGLARRTPVLIRCARFDMPYYQKDVCPRCRAD